MRIYADQPAHRLRQIIADLLGVGWCILAVLAGKAVYDLIDTLAGPGRLLEDAGNGLADNLSGAGDNLSGIPLIGDAVSGPFQGAAGAAGNVAGAGQTVQDVVGTMATLAGVATAGFLILLAVLFWITAAPVLGPPSGGRTNGAHRPGRARVARPAGAGHPEVVASGQDR